MTNPLTGAERNRLMRLATIYAHKRGSVAVLSAQTVMANGTKLFCLFYPVHPAANKNVFRSA
ncbi:MAG: hypothetical protein OSB62_02460 [Alphaproteobacteria bacterium]|nr:hypothetical protein [Alphaproteobacteria bacterium]